MRGIVRFPATHTLHRRNRGTKVTRSVDRSSNTKGFLPNYTIKPWLFKGHSAKVMLGTLCPPWSSGLWTSPQSLRHWTARSTQEEWSMSLWERRRLTYEQCCLCLFLTSPLGALGVWGGWLDMRQNGWKQRQCDSEHEEHTHSIQPYLEKR